MNSGDEHKYTASDQKQRSVVDEELILNGNQVFSQLTTVVDLDCSLDLWWTIDSNWHRESLNPVSVRSDRCELVTVELKWREVDPWKW